MSAVRAVAWAIALVGLAGCAGPASPPQGTEPGWYALHGSGGGALFGHDAGWFTFVPSDDALTHMRLPTIGDVTIHYMPHGAPQQPTWYRLAGDEPRWACCKDAPVQLLGHGGAWQGIRDDTWVSDESLVELAIHPAGVEGIVGIANARPGGMPEGDYLLRFRLGTGDGAVWQELRVEKVDCRTSATEVAWYGCGSDPVMAEGDVAPM